MKTAFQCYTKIAHEGVTSMDCHEITTIINMTPTFEWVVFFICVPMLIYGVYVTFIRKS
jgi:hypothetical protein